MWIFEDQNVPLRPSIRWLPMWRCLLVVSARKMHTRWVPRVVVNGVITYKLVTGVFSPPMIWGYNPTYNGYRRGPRPAKQTNAVKNASSNGPTGCFWNQWETEGFTTWFSNHRPDKCGWSCSLRLMLEWWLCRCRLRWYVFLKFTYIVHMKRQHILRNITSLIINTKTNAYNYNQKFIITWPVESDGRELVASIVSNRSESVVR